MENTKKIEDLLVLIFLESTKNTSLGEKAKKLTIAGFSHADIARFLDTTPAVIKQSVYMARKGKKK